MVKQEFLGRFYYNDAGGSNDLSVGGASIDLDSGYYYLCGYSGESTDNLLEHIAATIGGGATVVYNHALKRVVFNLASPATLQINDTALQAVLGFTSGLKSSASTHTGTVHPRYLWSPSQGASYHDVDYKTFWAPRSSTKYCRSANGVTYSVVGTKLYDCTLEFGLLDESEVITPSTALYEDFQQWYEDVLHEGRQFRVILDTTGLTTSYASTNYVTAMYGMPGSSGTEPIGAFDAFANRHIDNYQGLWNVRIPLVKYVSAS